jgi:HAD superfamily hydrolase (TIGR01490 family)
VNLALFDFDGTITRTDTFTAFLRYAVRRERQLAAWVVLWPLLVAYKTGLVAGRTTRPIAAWCGFTGERAEHVRELGRRYAQDVLPRVVRRRARERIAWHQQQRDTIVVVSASLDVYLRPWCESIGVDVICTELEVREGRFTGRYVSGDCSAAEKAHRVRQRYDVASYPVVYAYGDTAEDCDMLSMAQEKYYRWQKMP